MKKILSISFVIPLVRSGGVFVVLEYYCRLMGLGHKVNIHYPLLQHCEFPKSTPSWKRFLIRRLIQSLCKFSFCSKPACSLLSGRLFGET